MRLHPFPSAERTTTSSTAPPAVIDRPATIPLCCTFKWRTLVPAWFEKIAAVAGETIVGRGSPASPRSVTFGSRMSTSGAPA